MNIIKTITHSYDGGQTVIKTEMTSMGVNYEPKKIEKDEIYPANNHEDRSSSDARTNVSTEDNAILIGSTYRATNNDFYIGVDSNESVTVYLPEDPFQGKRIIVKAEMKPPLGSRIITVKSSNDSLIDGYSDQVIQVSHGCLSVIFRGQEWHIIK